MLRSLSGISLGIKTYLVTGLLLVGLIAFAYTAIVSIDVIRSAYDAVTLRAREQILAAEAIIQTTEAVHLDLVSNNERQILGEGAAKQASLLSRLAQDLGQLDAAFQRMAEMELQAKEQLLVDQMRPALEALRSQAGLILEINQAPGGSQLYFDQPAERSFRSLRRLQDELLGSLHTVYDHELEVVSLASVRLVRNVVLVSFAILLISSLLSFIVGYLLVTKPLLRLADSTSRMAGGDYEVEINDLRRRDEIGMISRSMNVFRRNAVEREKLDADLLKSVKVSSRARRMLLALCEASSNVLQLRNAEEIYARVGADLRKLGYQAALLVLSEDRTHLEYAYVAFDRWLMTAAELLHGGILRGMRCEWSGNLSYLAVIEENQSIFSTSPLLLGVKAPPEAADASQEAWRVFSQAGASILAPLAPFGKTIGVLLVIGEDLTVDDIPVINTFSDHAGIALENTALYQEAQTRQEELADRLDDLASLSEITALVTTSRSMDGLLDEALDLFCRKYGAEMASISLFDRQKNQLYTVALRGVPLELPIEARYADLGAGLSGRAIREQRAVVMDSASDYPGPLIGFLQELGIESVVSFPLVGNDHLIGSMSLGSKQPQFFRSQNVDLLVDLGKQLAIGIEKGRMQSVIAASESKYRTLFDGIPVGLFQSTIDGSIVDANRALALMMGFSSREDMIGKDASKWYSFPEERNVWVHEAQRRGAIQGYETQFKRQDGSLIWVRISARLVLDEHGQPSYFDGSAEDISAQKQLEIKLRELSYHDALTGLYNRGYLKEELARLAGSRSFPVGIIIADIDGLKAINDRFGHPAGDDVLVMVAKVFNNSFRSEDIIARIGGDEFAVILPQTDAARIEQAVHRIRRGFREMLSQNPRYTLGLSLGAANSPQDGDLQQAMKVADDRMYADKRARAAGRKSPPPKTKDEAARMPSPTPRTVGKSTFGVQDS